MERHGSNGCLGPPLSGVRWRNVGETLIRRSRRWPSDETGRDQDWFATDWMDTTRSQEMLSFQHHSLPDVLAETRDIVGWRRWPLRTAAPILRAFLQSRSPYRNDPGVYADPWGAIGRRWGDPSPDPSSSHTV